MYKLIVAVVIMALSQTAMGANESTLAKAIEVAQQMKADADEAYVKGVAKRTELRQWPEAAIAIKRIQTRYDLLNGIYLEAQASYDYYGRCWTIGLCFEHQMAALYWKGLRDTTHLGIGIAQAWLKPNGTTMTAELSRAERHLEWAKKEEARALVISGFVKGAFNIDEYKQLADRTVNTASADVLKAEPVVEEARSRIKAVSDEVLEEVRQAKYKEANDYLNAQKAICDAEQAAIDKARAEQVIIRDAEMETTWLLFILQSLYGAQQGVPNFNN